MSEGIEFNDIGTVDVTFDDKTYHLGRPKFRQFKYFTSRLDDVVDSTRDEVARLRADAEAAAEAHDENPTVETEQAKQAAADAANRFSRKGFYEYTIAVLAEMFEQLGDPLPDDPDEWPAWLAADSALPGRITAHWRSHPKASSNNDIG